MNATDQSSVRVTRCHRSSMIKPRSINAIHATIEPSERILVENHNNFFSFSTILATRFRRNLSEKKSNSSQNPFKMIKTSTPSTTSSQTIWNSTILTTDSSQQRNDLPKNVVNHLLKKTQVKKCVPSSSKMTAGEETASNNHRCVPITNAWSDEKGITIDHHRRVKQKKKKQFSHFCICASVLITILLIAVIIILTILLVKSKTTTTTITLRWSSVGVTVAGITGQNGTTPSQLKGPFGLTLNFNNTLYIADYQNNRIQMFSSGTSTGKTAAGYANGTAVTSSSGFFYSSDVIVDSNDNMYVSDIGNARIQFWPNGASYGTEIAGFGGGGSLNNQLNQPYSIARDSSSGTLYIADSQNHRIMRYTLNASTGDIVAGGHASGTNSTQLNSPIGVYLDLSSNSLIIANSYAHNIVRWELGASSWTLVAGSINGSYGNTSTLFFYPYDVILDPMGNIYVADTANHRIQFFLAGQSEGLTIAGITSVPGNSSTSLNAPYSLALDSQLNLYVSDTSNHRIQKFVRY